MAKNRDSTTNGHELTKDKKNRTEIKQKTHTQKRHTKRTKQNNMVRKSI
jgi:hypothetical protein